MSEVLFPADAQPSDGPGDVSVRVVSRAEITDAEVRSIAALIDAIAAATAAASRSHERDATLFNFGGPVTG